MRLFEKVVTRPLQKTSLMDFFFVLVTIISITCCGLLFRSWITFGALSVFFLCAVVTLGLFLEEFPVLLAAISSALSLEFFFLPPKFDFHIEKFADRLMLFVFFILALVIGRFTGRLRASIKEGRLRERRAFALYNFIRAIAFARFTREIIRISNLLLAEMLEAQVSIFTLGENGEFTKASGVFPEFDEESKKLAAWVYKNRTYTDRFTDLRDHPEILCIPLSTGEITLGVLALKLTKQRTLTIDQKDLIEALSTQIALCLDRERLRMINEETHSMREADKLYRALIDSVSHELKTPLTVSEATAKNLGEAEIGSSKILAQEINPAVRRLQRLVNNLSDMARIESGYLRPNFDWFEVSDIIKAAVETNRVFCSGRQITISLTPELPLVKVDFGLMQEVLSNLIHNACHHGGKEVEITLSAGVEEFAKEIWISVTDSGPGIPESQIDKIFDKFYQVKTEVAGGLGLGLSIVKRFVEAHQGRVTLENMSNGGARFTIFLHAKKCGGISAQ
ncbi:MAG TPA: ATP-binding protein [Opitutaceae bacterium]|nr:ATP-binding protein [Opitutaceae bacterium]